MGPTARFWTSVAAGVLVIILVAIFAAIILAMAGPASAHTRWCGHGEHYLGHKGAYILEFEREFERRGRHIHVVEKRTDKTWYGSYTRSLGTTTIDCGKA